MKKYLPTVFVVAVILAVTAAIASTAPPPIGDTQDKILKELTLVRKALQEHNKIQKDILREMKK